jgi:Tol biopolymer transport system component
MRCSGLSLSGDGSLVAYANGAATVHDLETAIEVVYDPTDVSDVAISPDGRDLLIGGLAGTVHRVRLDGGEPEPEVLVSVGRNAGPAYAAWSPDGRRIAYVVDVPLPADTVGVPWEYQLWVLDADGGNRQMIWTRPGCCMRFWAGTSWSPDGTQLTAVLGGPSSVWIVNADGTGAHALASVSSERVAWRPRP